MSILKRIREDNEQQASANKKQHGAVVPPLLPPPPPQIIFCRMRMRSKIDPCPEGYVRVFPNYRHQNRKDGIGMTSLSPMRLGPVYHGQPGLPWSLNLENFHQGSKRFSSELDDQQFHLSKCAWYMDNMPHRHKQRGRNPCYFSWVTTSPTGVIGGVEHRLTYIQSRQFYCTFYERLVKDLEDYHQLLAMIKNGHKIQLCGYDAHPIDSPAECEKAYLDPSKPFGHERVLYTMLMIQNKAEYPWRKHTTFVF